MKEQRGQWSSCWAATCICRYPKAFVRKQCRLFHTECVYILDGENKRKQSRSYFCTDIWYIWSAFRLLTAGCTLKSVTSRFFYRAASLSSIRNDENKIILFWIIFFKSRCPRKNVIAEQCIDVLGENEMTFVHRPVCYTVPGISGE